MNRYRENIKKYNSKKARLTKVLNRISLLRLSIFVLSAVLLIALFSLNLTSPAFVVLSVSVMSFAVVVRHHNKVAYLKKHASFLKSINEAEIKRAEGNLETFDTGQQFISQTHPYTSDLDIFGQHSIFQMVNRTTTESGRVLLSEWLLEPAPKAEIMNRQKAIKELTEKLDWRQDFQASGMHFENKTSDYNKLLTWVDAPVALLKHRQMYIAAAIILSVLSLLGLYLSLSKINSSYGYIYFLSFILVLFVNYIILRKVNPLAGDIVETASANLNTLRGYRTLINKIEGERFNTDKLVQLKCNLKKSKYSAFHEINKLCKILDFSHQRPIKKIPIGGNYLYPLLNFFLLLDIYLIIGTEKWKTKNKAFLKGWAQVVSTFEVINSFAGFCYSNPSYAFPEITEQKNFVHFEQLGHPLIKSKNRVCNSFQSKGQGDMTMITGSNMGGKSTFLRTVGVNLVLALAGAPCCARYAKVASLQLFTSMRTQDNLKKGVSSFYAELDRIEKMLKLIERNDNVFFLLDEMFKGTNSEDRHKGGFSLINQISELKTSGIIATHDIDLAKLLGNKQLVTNYSFNSEIKDDSMIFSYELQPGICTDFNASELMKRSGIKILPDSGNGLDEIK